MSFILDHFLSFEHLYINLNNYDSQSSCNRLSHYDSIIGMADPGHYSRIMSTENPAVEHVKMS